MGILKKIFTSIPEWWKLVPDQSLFADGGQTEGAVLRLAARHENGLWALFYLGQADNIKARLKKLSSNANFIAYWIDPRNGNKVDAGKNVTGGEMTFVHPDNWEDAILLIEITGTD